MPMAWQAEPNAAPILSCRHKKKMNRSITAEDTVVVRGTHLFKRDGSIFTIRGVAFPTPPEDDVGVFYNASAWLDILKQLRELDLQFNTVRLYRMDPLKVDYSEFIEGAAELGVYIIVPLTAASGGGVLDRTLPAPRCYKKSLFNYGANALYQYLKHPNVLGKCCSSCCVSCCTFLSPYYLNVICHSCHSLPIHYSALLVYRWSGRQ